MRNRIIVIGAIVALGYWFGTRATRPVNKKSKTETAREIWNDPKTKKARKKLKKKLKSATSGH